MTWRISIFRTSFFLSKSNTVRNTTTVTVLARPGKQWDDTTESAPPDARHPRPRSSGSEVGRGLVPSWLRTGVVIGRPSRREVRVETPTDWEIIFKSSPLRSGIVPDTTKVRPTDTPPTAPEMVSPPIPYVDVRIKSNNDNDCDEPSRKNRTSLFWNQLSKVEYQTRSLRTSLTYRRNSSYSTFSLVV